MPTKIIKTVQLILCVGLFSCVQDPNTQQKNDSIATHEQSKKKAKIDTRTLELNNQLCDFVTNDNFVFDNNVKQQIDSLIKEGASFNCDCNYSGSYTKTGFLSGQYIRAFFGKAPKTVSYTITKPFLHFAYHTENTNFIKYLVDKKADFNCKNSDEENLLVSAARENDIKAINKLITLGCKASDMVIIPSNDVNTIDLLIKNGASANNVDYNFIVKNTGMNDDASSARIIRKYNPSLKNKQINLDEMFFWNPSFVLELLKHGMDVNTVYKNESLLCKAIKEYDNEMITYIMANGFDVKDDELNSYTALLACIETNNFELFNKLLTLGANINHSDKVYGNAFYICAQNKKNPIQFADVLFSKRVALNAESYSGNALHAAIQEDNTIYTKWLLNKGISIEENSTNNGDCLFFKAIRNNDVEIVKQLVEKGVRRDCTDYFGKPIMDYAKKNCSKKMVDYLKSIKTV